MQPTFASIESGLFYFLSDQERGGETIESITCALKISLIEYDRAKVDALRRKNLTEKCYMKKLLLIALMSVSFASQVTHASEQKLLFCSSSHRRKRGFMKEVIFPVVTKDKAILFLRQIVFNSSCHITAHSK
jgi:hypothetical protein